LTDAEAIRQLTHQTDAPEHAPEAYAYAVDAITERSALKAARALSSRPPTLDAAHDVIARMDTQVTDATADVVALRKRLHGAREAFIRMRDAWVVGSADDADEALRGLAEVLGVSQ
jgi:hypothetical protein